MDIAINGFFEAIHPVVYYTVSIWFLTESIIRISGKENRKIISEIASGIFAVLAVIAIGGVTGFTGGLSRVGVVGQILPAVLGLLGAISIYLFGIKDVPKPITFLLVLGFSSALFMGYNKGADLRSTSESYNSYLKACQSLFFNSEIYTDPVALDMAAATHLTRCESLFASEFIKAKRFSQ